MPFIIVSREGDSVRLVSETAFQRQEDAIDAITSALAAGTLERGTGFLLLDMERAMPVAVVQVAEPPTLRFDDPVEGVSEEAPVVVPAVEENRVMDSQEPEQSVESEVSQDASAEALAGSVGVEEGEDAGILDLVAETVSEPEPLLNLSAPLEVPVVELPEVELPNLPAEETAQFETTAEEGSCVAEGSIADEVRVDAIENTQPLEDLETRDDIELAAEVVVSNERDAVDVVEETEDAQESAAESVEEDVEGVERVMAAALDELLGDARLDTNLEEVDEAASGSNSIAAEAPPEALARPLDVTPTEGSAEEPPRWPWDSVVPEEPASAEVEQIQSAAASEPQAGLVGVEEQRDEAAETEPEPVGSVEEPQAALASDEVAHAPEEEPGHEEAAVAEAEVIVEAEAVVAAMESEDVGVADAPGYEAGDCDLSALTCVDCVYVNTCPNREERTPATCGSFQWTSV